MFEWYRSLSGPAVCVWCVCVCKTSTLCRAAQTLLFDVSGGTSPTLLTGNRVHARTHTHTHSQAYLSLLLGNTEGQTAEQGRSEKPFIEPRGESEAMENKTQTV